MGTTDVNAVFLGRLSVAFRQEERLRALVHGRPISVSPQTQQQFKYPGIGLRAYASLHPRFVSLTRPRHQPPVFVIDEDSAKLHIRSLLIDIPIWEFKGRQFCRSGIGPPFPRRDAQQPGDLQQAVCHPVGIAARDTKGVARNLQPKCLLTVVQRPPILADNDASLFPDTDLRRQHLCHVAGQHSQCRFHHRLCPPCIATYGHRLSTFQFKGPSPHRQQSHHNAPYNFLHTYFNFLFSLFCHIHILIRNTDGSRTRTANECNITNNICKNSAEV